MIDSITRATELVTCGNHSNTIDPLAARRLLLTLNAVAGLESDGGSTTAWSTSAPMRRTAGYLVAVGEPATRLVTTTDSDELFFHVFEFVNRWYEYGSTQYLGLWADATGATWIDACEYHSNMHAARAAADRAEQLAYWDITNGVERLASLGEYSIGLGML
ncbi:hypothetical protein QM806_14300 [Rhodococcus sp. IEGM 1351]|uniref:hypothetical protein n=1 Tax=Rhodococcus sp. IEGM 1351 TaxID=3047089 RepID=UPI0024B659CA|nr:hypothetical protein [Rhodococcus sp. IEGM 1351]MDI9936590.1 hypothetical protein [Rhodococcus sp. IEGM 1351]